MKTKELMSSKKMNTKFKYLMVMLAGLVLTACSEGQQEQSKEAVKEAATAVEEAELVVSESKELIVDKAEDTTELVADVHVPEVAESAPVVEDIIPVVDATAVPEKGAEPKTHIIKAAVTQFRPLVVFANPGDTIVWQNMNGHDTTSMKGMLPEGADTWQSKMGELFSLTVQKEGAYLYKCTSHASLGMMGAIIVGHSDNLETIKSNVDASGEPKCMVKRVIRKVEKELSKK